MWCGSICDSALRLGVRSTGADFFLLQIAEVNVVENVPQAPDLLIFARVRSRALFNKERGREGYTEMRNSGITPALSAPPPPAPPPSGHRIVPCHHLLCSQYIIRAGALQDVSFNL